MNANKTMKALVLRRHGGLDDLQVVTDYPVPKAAEGQVVIRVRASSFNYHDVFTMRGMPGIKVPLPVIIGLDMAGEIAEVGPGAAAWKAGDRVLVNPVNKKKGLMGEMLDGGMAEYCLVAADQLVAMPAGVSFEQAASLPVAYGTAHRMLVTHETVKKGERVLILGASGGVGTGCVILAKLLGAEVIACTSSAEKMNSLKELGADEVINIKETDFSRWAVEKYGKPQRRSFEGGVDVVINFTGGDTWVPSLRCLKRGGKLLVCGATAGYDPKEDLRYVWSFELKIIGSNSFYDDNLKGLMDLINEGKMKPVIDKVLPLDQAREVDDRRIDDGAPAGADHPRALSSMARAEGGRGRRRWHRAQGDLARGMGGQSGTPLYPWRRAGGAGRSRRRLGDGETDRPRRADHRPAGRLSCRRDARRPDRARQGGPLRRPVLDRRGAGARPGRQAPRQRPRHLLHRAAEGVMAEPCHFRG